MYIVDCVACQVLATCWQPSSVSKSQSAACNYLHTCSPDTNNSTGPIWWCDGCKRSLSGQISPDATRVTAINNSFIHYSTLRMIPRHVSFIGQHHLTAITLTVKSHEHLLLVLKKVSENNMLHWPHRCESMSRQMMQEKNLLIMTALPVSQFESCLCE